MNIAVTGATGFVGVNLIPYLRKHGFNIFPFSRALTYSYSDLKPDLINNNKINVIVHLAGKAHDLKKTSEASEYFEANTNLTIRTFDTFLNSSATIFIYLSSIKAVVDSADFIVDEDIEPSPITEYGKSKLLAEKYIGSCVIPNSKKVFILRPCMIHGPNNKGNLNLLYKLVSKNIPWPLGKYENKRSLCSIDNLMFIIQEIIEREDIPSGIYNISDDNPVSSNDIIKLISQSNQINAHILKFPFWLIKLVAKTGDVFNLPINTDKLKKLTDSFVVSNSKIKQAIGKKLPISAEEGLLKTFQSFKLQDASI